MKTVIAFLLFALTAQAQSDTLRARTLKAADAVHALVAKHACKSDASEDMRKDDVPCIQARRDEYQQHPEIYNRAVLGILDEFKTKGVDTEVLRGEAKAGNAEKVYDGLMKLADKIK